MEKRSDTATRLNRRIDPRIDMAESVSVRLETDMIVGPGQNISAQGLFFITDGAIPVTVKVGGVAEPVRGELVRVTAMGDGRLGIAVRFVEPGTGS